MKETLCRGFPTLSRDEQTALGHGVRAFTRLPRGRGGPVGRAVWKRLAFGLLRAVVWNPIQSRASSFDHANCEPGFFVAVVESSSRKGVVGRGVEYPKKRWGESFGLEVVRAWLTSRGSLQTCVAVTIPPSQTKWKFDMKRDLGIYLGDADDTKRGVLFLNPTTGAIDVRLDFIKLELTDS